MEIFMNKFMCAALTATMSLGLIATPVHAKKGSFNLQVIAFENCPAGDFTGSERHQIAVEADFIADAGEDNTGSGLTTTQAGKNKNNIIRNNTIQLMQSPDDKFHVVDGNACSGNKGSAKLQLPITVDNLDCGDQEADCPNPDFTEYRVYVRLVGKPYTGIGVTTCASEKDGQDTDNDGETDEVVCSTESVELHRGKGKNSQPKWEDYTKELLTLCLDVSDTGDDDGLDGICDIRFAVFDPTLEDYFWQWNTQGKAHAQLKFIPVPQ